MRPCGYWVDFGASLEWPSTLPRWLHFPATMVAAWQITSAHDLLVQFCAVQRSNPLQGDSVFTSKTKPFLYISMAISLSSCSRSVASPSLDLLSTWSVEPGPKHSSLVPPDRLESPLSLSTSLSASSSQSLLRMVDSSSSSWTDFTSGCSWSSVSSWTSSFLSSISCCRSH